MIIILEVDYDLSDVMFVTTANTLNILPPLLDRMEVIRFLVTQRNEKINISQKYLIPNQSKNNGLKTVNGKLMKILIEKLLVIILGSPE